MDENQTTRIVDAVLTELRAEMGAQQMNSRALAERAGLPYVSVLRYLSGERSMPLPVLVEFLEALELEPNVFWRRVKVRAA